MSMKNYIAVIGGDKRQLYICKLLALKGMKVMSIGVDMNGEVLENVTIADSLKQVMEECNLIIGPIPFSRDGIQIASNINANLEIEEFVELIRSNHTIIGGNINNKIIEAVKNQKGEYFDFMKDDDIAEKNAIATAEGTIAEAIKLSDINLFQSKCLVLGYGRCAKALALRIKALGADVTISARNSNQRHCAIEDSMSAISLEDTQSKLSEFDFIFNTVPAMLLTCEWVKACREDAIIIDIASKPGGTDFSMCEQVGIKAVLALGLPGKYSPKTSAEILVDSICHLLPQ
jgi:dipicolinate synthase subunit A